MFTPSFSQVLTYLQGISGDVTPAQYPTHVGCSHPGRLSCINNWGRSGRFVENCVGKPAPPVDVAPISSYCAATGCLNAESFLRAVLNVKARETSMKLSDAFCGCRKLTNGIKEEVHCEPALFTGSLVQTTRSQEADAGPRRPARLHGSPQGLR